MLAGLTAGAADVLAVALGICFLGQALGGLNPILSSEEYTSGSSFSSLKAAEWVKGLQACL